MTVTSSREAINNNLVHVFDGDAAALRDALGRDSAAPGSSVRAFSPADVVLEAHARDGSAASLLVRQRAALPVPEVTRAIAAPPRALTGAEADAALRDLRRVLYAAHVGNETILTDTMPDVRDLAGVIPALRADDLGSKSFRDAYGLRFRYLAGAMAGGIASIDLVVAMGKGGFMGFFGAGAVPLPRIEEAIHAIKSRLDGGEPFGFNLLHNAFEPQVEMATVELYLKHQVHNIDAAAFMDLSPAVVYFRAKGLRELPDGRVVGRNHVFAKVSRPEVAGQFMAPAPEATLRELVAAGLLSEKEARLASLVPVAEDVTAEADSGGHTDQRPLPVLLPLMLRLRDEAHQKYGFSRHGMRIRVGAGGGIGDPMSAYAAFALGADYLMTGSVNQACLEAGTSEAVKRMLLDADMADVTMAPAPDMFELGARVQVLRRGTLYPQRAQKLYEIYKLYPSFEAVPEAEREKVEKTILRRPFAEVWADTEKYWQGRDPQKADEARRDPRVQMALCFRWYLGMASRWAATGDEARRADYQVWCGPAIGALNRWTRGTWLGTLEAREAAVIGKAMLFGAAALTRRAVAARAGVDDLPSAVDLCRPPSREELG